MSGIAGVIRFHGVVAASELDAMPRTMARRGPDRQVLRCRRYVGP